MRRQNKFKIDILYHTEREKDMCVYDKGERESGWLPLPLLADVGGERESRR